MFLSYIFGHVLISCYLTNNPHRLHTNTTHPHKQIYYMFLVIGEAIRIKLFPNRFITGLFSLYWSRTHSNADLLPSL